MPPRDSRSVPLTTTLLGIESRTSRVSASKTLGAGAGSSWPAAACACVAEPALAAGADDGAAVAARRGRGRFRGRRNGAPRRSTGRRHRSRRLRLELRRLHRVRIARGHREHPAHVDGARVHGERAFDAGLPELARDSHVRIELDVGELVVDDLELIGLDRDLHAADLALVHGELARHAQRVLVFVQQAELLDLDAIGRQRDPRVEAGVAALRQLGDGEGAIADVDGPAQVRVPAATRSPARRPGACRSPWRPAARRQRSTRG